MAVEDYVLPLVPFIGPSIQSEQSGREKTKAVGRYQGGLAALRQQAEREYPQRAARAINRFDRASGMLDRYNEPNYEREFYAGQPRTQGPAPSYSRNYYSSYRAPSTITSQYRSRSSTGYRYDPMRDQATMRRGELDRPTEIGRELESLRSGLPGGWLLRGRSNERRQLGPTELDRRYRERQDINNRPTSTSQLLYELTDPRFAAERVDRALKEGREQPVDRYTGEVYNTFKGGKSRTAGLLGTLQGERGTDPFQGRDPYGQVSFKRTADFLDKFDPRAGALDETYGRLKAEGPTYEEKFYLDQLRGENPAYAQLRGDFQKDARRAAAARGGFVSGQAMDYEQRGLSRLAADEFARRGELAGRAGEARRARLGQQLGGATALEQARLGRAGLQAETGLGFERQGLDLARERAGRDVDKARLGLDRDRLLGDLAGREDEALQTLGIKRDEFGHRRFADLSELARAGDTAALGARQLRGTVASREDALRAEREAALDKFASDIGERDEARNKALDDLALQEETARSRTIGQRLEAGKTVDDLRFRNLGALDDIYRDVSKRQYDEDRALDELAGKSSDEELEGLRLGGTLAQGASAEGFREQEGALEYQKFLRDLAVGAGREQEGSFKTRFDAAMRLGDSQSAIDLAYDRAEMAARQGLSLQELDAELQKAGVPAQVRQQIAQNWENTKQDVSQVYSAGGFGQMPPGGYPRR